MDKMKQYEASLELMEKQKLIDNRINKEINAIKYQKNNLPDNYSKEELEDIMKSEKELEEFFKEINGDNSKENEQKLFNATTVEESFLNVGIGVLNVNDNLKKLIRCQNFVEGFWDINNETEIIKAKYGKEFKLLKKLEGKNIDDNVAMTIIIIYFINKEYSKYVNEMMMIIKKAKLYVQTKVWYSCEKIINEIF